MTVALAARTSTTPPLIRLRPAPSPEPPYEDEPDRLADDWWGPAGPASGTTAADLPDWPAAPAPAVPPTRSGPAMSEAQVATRRYLALCVEVLGGFRPLRHLRMLTSVAAFEGIAAQLTRVARPPATGTRPAPDRRVLLRDYRLCEPRDGVAEVAAVLGRAEQVWAVALRLERHRGTWLCSHLEML